MKPLHIPKNKRVKFLKVFCYQCQTDITELCKSTGKALRNCKYGERHRFKIYYPDPLNPKKRKTKTLETRDLNEATKEVILIQDMLRRGQLVNLPKVEVHHRDYSQNNNTLLLNAIAKYMASLHGEGVPVHKRKDVSLEHIRDIERAFNALVESLHHNGEDVKSFPITQINDHTAGNFLEFLQEKKHLQNRSVNKYVGNVKPFLRWFSKEFNMPINNYFAEIPKLPERYIPEIIPKKDFEALMNILTKEKGIPPYIKGKEKKRNFYKSYLKQALLWALHTGMRREELINLKHSDVKDFGDYKMLEIENLKVNRIQKRRDESEKIYTTIPVTRMIDQLLTEAEHEQHQGTNRFIIEPDLTENRIKSMKDGISRGFDHYFKLVQPDSNLTFKNLRKTFLTGLDLYMNGQAVNLTHSDRKVLDEHYISKREKAKKAVGYEVYPEEIERTNELNQLRNEENNPSRNKNNEVER